MPKNNNSGTSQTICHPANKVYFKLAVEELNTIFGVLTGVRLLTKRIDNDLSRNDENVYNIFAALLILNVIVYIISSWYIGFYRGPMRRRWAEIPACGKCCCAPCIIVEYIFGSFMAIVFPIWGVQICHCCETKSVRRRRKEGAIIYQKSIRLYAWEDLILDLPLFLTNLYLSRENLNATSTGFAFLSAALFLYSIHILYTVPKHSSWQRTDSELRAEKKAEKHQLKKKREEYRKWKKQQREKKRLKMINNYKRNLWLAPTCLIVAIILAAIYFSTQNIIFLGISAIIGAYGVGGCMSAYGNTDPTIYFPRTKTCPKCLNPVDADMLCMTCIQYANSVKWVRKISPYPYQQPFPPMNNEHNHTHEQMNNSIPMNNSVPIRPMNQGEMRIVQSPFELNANNNFNNSNNDPTFQQSRFVQTPFDLPPPPYSD